MMDKKIRIALENYAAIKRMMRKKALERVFGTKIVINLN